MCVRSCDGFFFPLSHAPGGRSGADEMCQALCPGAETAAYSMPGGETTELDRALSLKGKPYTRLVGAFKFQKAFDPSCFCKKDGQTWAQVLARAETMLGRRPGDIIVTAQKAEELSRPKIAMAARRGRDKKKPADVESTGSVPIVAHASAAVPTASQASAGIGPKSIEGAKVLDRTDGPKRELTDTRARSARSASSRRPSYPCRRRRRASRKRARGLLRPFGRSAAPWRAQSRSAAEGQPAPARPRARERETQRHEQRLPFAPVAPFTASVQVFQVEPSQGSGGSRSRPSP